MCYLFSLNIKLRDNIRLDVWPFYEAFQKLFCPSKLAEATVNSYQTEERRTEKNYIERYFEIPNHSVHGSQIKVKQIHVFSYRTILNVLNFHFNITPSTTYRIRYILEHFTRIQIQPKKSSNYSSFFCMRI